MNVDGGALGTGVLNINAGYEGLDSELHLTINGGSVNIFSQDDGINVNEDGVSVVTVNGGSLHILAGLGDEGDGIDSNGYLVINGGTVISMAKPNSDSGLDSDFGSYINGGTVVALGSTMDWAESSDSAASGQATMNLQFASSQSADEAIIITDTDGKVVFAYDPDKDEVAEGNARWYQGAIISCAALQVGKSYLVYVGGDVEGTETAGVYDASTVTGFTSDAKQQCYTGTGSFGRPGGGFGGGQQPDGEMPQMPEGGFTGGDRPDGMPEIPEGGFDGQQSGEAPQLPDGQQPQMPDGQQPDGQAPQMPDGQQPDGEQPQMPENGFGGGQETTGEAVTVFALTEAVNGFSGVKDYDESAATETPGENDQPQTSASFTDVASNSWYADAVRYVLEKGLMNGTSSTTFSPLVETDRAMIVTILYRLEGSPAVSGGSSFSDVASDKYYASAVAWASENGIVTGYSNGTFGPTDKLTREQLAAILYRYAGYKGLDTSLSADLTGFTDADSISAYAQTAMSWANAAGLVNGVTDTTLSPRTGAYRAQVAAILMRLESVQ
jgi:hypothetical protein